MKENGHNEQMITLATKYLSGNANSEEIRELEAWVLADPEHKKQFMDLKKAWMLGGLLKEGLSMDVDLQWQQTAKQLSGNGKKEAKVVPFRRTLMRYAAGLAVLIAAAFLIWQFIGKDNTMVVEAKDRIEQFQLPDGSEITLNQGASLDYHLDKETSERINSLKGDAFFDVARNENSPFIIQTQGIEIEVLGTSFYVDSRPEQSDIQVIVEEGSVQVVAEGQEVILTANEKAVYRKADKTLVEKENDDLNFQSLQTNILEFKNTKLAEVVFALNRHFNTTISIQITDPANCEITATFNNKSLETIIAVIEQTLGIKATKEGDNYVLSGDKCE